uniref:Uncharacterized protein n=1 Tax=Glossina austeni TaxID=7395 RepID=A0A1A9VH10_GLOAU
MKSPSQVAPEQEPDSKKKKEKDKTNRNRKEISRKASHQIAKRHRDSTPISRHQLTTSAKSSGSPPRLTEHTKFSRQRPTRDLSSKSSADGGSTLPAIESRLASSSVSKS